MPDFRIGADGVQLGWNVFVAVAAGALGLYIASVVAPLDKRVSLVEQKVDHVEKEMDEVKDSVKWLRRREANR